MCKSGPNIIAIYIKQLRNYTTLPGSSWAAHWQEKPSLTFRLGLLRFCFLPFFAVSFFSQTNHPPGDRIFYILSKDCPTAGYVIGFVLYVYIYIEKNGRGIRGNAK